ncbi:hypothetical protein Efla_001406 [Eimeria flavescens]
MSFNPFTCVFCFPHRQGDFQCDLLILEDSSLAGSSPDEPDHAFTIIRSSSNSSSSSSGSSSSGSTSSNSGGSNGVLIGADRDGLRGKRKGELFATRAKKQQKTITPRHPTEDIEVISDSDEEAAAAASAAAASAAAASAAAASAAAATAAAATAAAATAAAEAVLIISDDEEE